MKLTTSRGQPRHQRAAPELHLIVDDPVAPDYFDAETVSIWQATARILIDRHDLTTGDLGILEVYASNLAVFRQANRQLAIDGLTLTDPKGAIKSHPLLATRKGAEQQITIASTQLGLSPAARRTLKHLTDGDAAPGHSDKAMRGF